MWDPILYQNEKCEGGIFLFFDSRQSNVTVSKFQMWTVSGGWCYLGCGVSSVLVNKKYNMKKRIHFSTSQDLKSNYFHSKYFIEDRKSIQKCYYHGDPSSIYSWSISHILEHEFFCFGCLGWAGSKEKKWIWIFLSNFWGWFFQLFVGKKNRTKKLPKVKLNFSFLNFLKK